MPYGNSLPLTLPFSTTPETLMPRKYFQRGLGARERQIMDAVYRLGEGSVAEVLAQLPDSPSYSAVRTMIRVLEKKGYLADFHQIFIREDSEALKAADISLKGDPPITLHVSGVPLRSVLELMLEPWGLDYRVDNGEVVIVPSDRAGPGRPMRGEFRRPRPLSWMEGPK